MQEIFDLKDEMTQHLLDRFGIAPEKSTLTIYSKREWLSFCENNLLGSSNLPLSSFAPGAYFAGDYSAHILYQPELASQSLFHEYFGHGLYDENTLLGELTHTLEKKMREAEQKAKIILPSEREIFRQTNQYAIELRELLIENEKHLEGFALWMQWYLSKVTGQQELFGKEFKKLFHQDACKKLISFSLHYGEEALLRNFRILK